MSLACLLPRTLLQSQTQAQSQNHSCPVEVRRLEGKGEGRFCVMNSSLQPIPSHDQQGRGVFSDQGGAECM